MKQMGKDLRNDRQGGIEGLPLQLLIMVLVAGIGSAVILGWMGGLEAPEAIATVHSSEAELVLVDDDGDGVHTADGLDLVVTVLDQEGDPIAGASVVLEGCGLKGPDGQSPHALTGEDGKAVFEGMSAFRYGSSVGFVTITVAKSGISASKSIMVPVVCA